MVILSGDMNFFPPDGIDRSFPGAFNLKIKQINKERKLIRKERMLRGWNEFESFP